METNRSIFDNNEKPFNFVDVDSPPMHLPKADIIVVSELYMCEGEQPYFSAETSTFAFNGTFMYKVKVCVHLFFIAFFYRILRLMKFRIS